MTSWRIGQKSKYKMQLFYWNCCVLRVKYGRGCSDESRVISAWPMQSACLAQIDGCCLLFIFEFQRSLYVTVRILHAINFVKMCNFDSIDSKNFVSFYILEHHKSCQNKIIFGNNIEEKRANALTFTQHKTDIVIIIHILKGVKNNSTSELFLYVKSKSGYHKFCKVRRSSSLR